MSYRDPALLPEDVPRLEKFTKYRCPVDTGLGHSGLWTGAMYGGQGPIDHLCACGEPLVAVVDDGHTYRVQFDTIDTHVVFDWTPANSDQFEWHTVTRDSIDRADIVAQYRSLCEMSANGSEPIRNVRLLRAATVWEEVTP